MEQANEATKKEMGRLRKQIRLLEALGGIAQKSEGAGPYCRRDTQAEAYREKGLEICRQHILPKSWGVSLSRECMVD